MNNSVGVGSGGMGRIGQKGKIETTVIEQQLKNDLKRFKKWSASEQANKCHNASPDQPSLYSKLKVAFIVTYFILPCDQINW